MLKLKTTMPAMPFHDECACCVYASLYFLVDCYDAALRLMRSRFSTLQPFQNL